MQDIIERLRKIKIVPVVKLSDPKHAVPLAKALVEGGLPCAEVTFRTAAAAESIRLMKEACPEMLVGAGTVLTNDQVNEAIAAGAEFIVSPGLNPRTVRYCQERQIPILPGVATASEIEQALELGITKVKFFPAEANGGLPAIKALAAPYNMMEFMPTGGVNPGNVKDYLGFSKIYACGGTWMVSEELMEKGEFEKIKELTKQAAMMVKN